MGIGCRPSRIYWHDQAIGARPDAFATIVNPRPNSQRPNDLFSERLIGNRPRRKHGRPISPSPSTPSRQAEIIHDREHEPPPFGMPSALEFSVGVRLRCGLRCEHRPHLNFTFSPSSTSRRSNAASVRADEPAPVHARLVAAVMAEADELVLVRVLSSLPPDSLDAMILQPRR